MTAGDTTCARCQVVIAPDQVAATLFGRHLCAPCYGSWVDWGATAFRIFLGETLAFSMPPEQAKGDLPPLG